LTFLTVCLFVSLSPPAARATMRTNADKCRKMQKDAHDNHRTSDDLDAPREPAWARCPAKEDGRQGWKYMVSVPIFYFPALFSLQANLRLRDRPRKCLNYRTPAEVFWRRTVALRM
jgi:hypothetical protein